MEHVPVSNASETHEIPAVSQITGQDVKIHESDLDVADSCKNPEPSMLELEKGVKIINQSDVYQIEDVLGSKGSTQLVTCRKEGTNDTVKVKIFRKEKHWQAEMEINVYNHLNDLDSGKTNLIRLIVSFTYKDCICLVFKLSYPRDSDSPEKQDPKPASVAENASTDVSEGPFTHPGSATEGENHKSGLNLTESSEEIQSSTLEVGKGVKIIDQLNVYIIERLHGSGTFGKVFKCKKEQTGEIVAIKVFNKYERYFADLELKAYNELSVLEADKNNLIRVFDSFIYKNHTCLVFEHLDVNLFQLVLRRRPRHLSVAEIRPIAEQLLVSLRALKSIGLTHTDIKPDNIMLVHSDSKPFKIKLIDFGLAVKTANLSSTSWMQPKGYRAPEVFLGLPRDEGIDMWGLGCVLVFLFVANHMFPLDDYRAMRQIVRLMGLPKGQHIRQLLKLDLKNHTEIAEIKAFINLLRKMLALNPADRIHPKNALKHKFIKMGHLPGSSSDTQQRKPTESHITDQDNVTEVETHKSVLYPTESQDDKESSTLKLEKERRDRGAKQFNVLKTSKSILKQILTSMGSQ
uniref:Protein kinase domain-containing protein n=1 Tax=Nothobranchius furzeri TaxID=105023 RepID=A0A8C6K823_NOTFU